jgi:hypothetical protein
LQDSGEQRVTDGYNLAPNEHAKVLELSHDAWKQPDRAIAELKAAKACEMYVFGNIPMNYISVVAIKIDSRLDRYSFLVRYAEFLIRISVKSGFTKVIGSVRIANLG